MFGENGRTSQGDIQGATCYFYLAFSFESIFRTHILSITKMLQFQVNMNKHPCRQTISTQPAFRHFYIYAVGRETGLPGIVDSKLGVIKNVHTSQSSCFLPQAQINPDRTTKNNPKVLL